MSRAKTVAGVLNASLRRVTHRWVKGTWLGKRGTAAQDGRGQNAYCLYGSVTRGKTSPETPQQAEALEFIKQSIADLYPAFGPATKVSIPDWNDKPMRKREDVVAVVTRARDLAKQRGV